VHSNDRRTEFDVVPSPSGFAERSELAVKLVDDILVPLHQRRVAEMGIDRSGLFEHYKLQLDSAEIATGQVRRIARIVVEALPLFESYHVLRAGLGELAFTLAAMGLKTVACEANSWRYDAILAGHKALVAFDPAIARRVTPNIELVPKLPTGNSILGIACHLIGFSADEEGSILQQLARYRALLVEPRTFLRVRATDGEQAAAVDALRRQGFTLTRDFPEAGVVYCAKPQ
jgi:hypothetical protein